MSIMTIDMIFFLFFNDDLLTEVLLFEYFNIYKDYSRVKVSLFLFFT